MMAFETDLLHAETVIQPEAAPQWDEADLVALQSDLLRFARIQNRQR